MRAILALMMGTGPEEKAFSSRLRTLPGPVLKEIVVLITELMSTGRLPLGVGGRC